VAFSCEPKSKKLNVYAESVASFGNFYVSAAAEIAPNIRIPTPYATFQIVAGSERLCAGWNGSLRAIPARHLRRPVLHRFGAGGLLAASLPGTRLVPMSKNIRNWPSPIRNSDGPSGSDRGTRLVRPSGSDPLSTINSFQLSCPTLPN
jgi:hypothetical protein